MIMTVRKKSNMEKQGWWGRWRKKGSKRQQKLTPQKECVTTVAWRVKKLRGGNGQRKESKEIGKEKE